MKDDRQTITNIILISSRSIIIFNRSNLHYNAGDVMSQFSQLNTLEYFSIVYVHFLIDLLLMLIFMKIVKHNLILLNIHVKIVMEIS